MSIRHDHGDLSTDPDLLHYLLDQARAEIRRLNLELRGAELLWTGEGREPTRAHSGDAGFDLYCAGGPYGGGYWFIEPGEFVDIDCGISVELPQGVWAMITGRSSTLRKRRLLVATGIIDQGYRGPLYAGVQNLSSELVKVESGERLAQLIPFPLVAETLKLRRVAELADSDRGDKGFGSSGI